METLGGRSMRLDYSPETLRQHAAHKERRARLYAKPIVKVASITPIVSYQPETIAAVDNATQEERWRKWFEDCHQASANDQIKGDPAISVICVEVRRQFGVEKMDFLSARRNQRFVVPRQVAMALCKRLTRKSLPEIGRRMGNRDHTTILHGCRRLQPVIDVVAARLEPNASISDWVAAMKDEVRVTPFARYGYMQKRKPRGQK